jgi:hypothetical protein
MVLLLPVIGYLGYVGIKNMDDNSPGFFDEGGSLDDLTDTAEAGFNSLKWVAIIAVILMIFWFLGPAGLAGWKTAAVR